MLLVLLVDPTGPHPPYTVDHIGLHPPLRTLLSNIALTMLFEAKKAGNFFRGVGSIPWRHHRRV